MRASLPAALAALVLAGSIHAQQVTGTISGTIRDAQQAVVAGAKVTLLNPSQGTVREITTGADGSFVFTPLQPSEYTVTIEAPGFKKFERRDIKVFANDRISLPDVVLEIGAVTESVLVEGTAVVLQTESAERAGIVTGRQVVDLAVNGRNFLDIARVIPGVVYTGGLGGIQSNGNRGNQNNLTLDGVNNVDTGSNGGTHTEVNLDAIGEFKVITNSQPAEFGRSAGAAINIITKSGTRDFHGTGYWFHRHEQFNANTFRNNADNLPRQLQRRNWFGYNIGGPVYIPGKFNTDRNKLFFFFAQEFQRQLVPQNLRNVTVPTELERRGDFSQTREADGTPVIIRDPTTNAPFPGNVIPQNRWSADGAKILNFYPKPNATGRDYNFQSQVSSDFPIRQEIYRGDYIINDQWRSYVRFVKDKREQNLPYGQWNADYNLPFSAMNFGTPGWSFIANVTTVINPTLTNEFIFGTSKNKLNIDPVDNTFDRSSLNLNYQMPFPDADPLGLVQNWRFGGVPNAPFTGFNGTPFRNFNQIWELTDNVGKVLGPHTLKAGLYIHYSQKDQTAFTSVNGNVWFDRDSANPNDTGWAFANALLGNYQRVQQSNVVHNGQYRSYNVEWFAQDSWKVTRRLTLDYGMRFYWVQPQRDAAGLTSSFNPSLFNPADRAVLVERIRQADGTIAGRNPLTGQIVPAALAGSLVNTGRGFVNGVYANGMGREADPEYPDGLIRDQGILFAPRFGMVYQLTPKTVLRMGGGVFYDRFQGNPVFDMLPNPPSTISPTFYYGNLATLGSSQGVFFPQNVRGFSEDGKVPTTYNWNFTVQQELPGRFLFDIAYVGTQNHHQLAITDYNAVPLGAAWRADTQDPTNANPQFNGRTNRPVNFYRPYTGYGEARITSFGASSNYHSLQTSLNRRIASGFIFGAAYTWSRTLGTANDDGFTLHPTNSRVADYGLMPFHRTHTLVFNYTWDVPKLARGFLDNPVIGGILNDWTISGITMFQSGQPDNINLNVTGLGDGADRNRFFTGSDSIAPRVVQVGDPNDGPKALDQYIDTSVFRLPPVGSQGFDSAPRNVYRPGINNWDINVFKNFPMGEGRRLQLRVEMFNAFNHTQWSDFNRTAQFDMQGNLTNLPTSRGGGGGRYGFGALTNNRDPRIIQTALKFYF